MRKKRSNKKIEDVLLDDYIIYNDLSEDLEEDIIEELESEHAIESFEEEIEEEVEEEPIKLKVKIDKQKYYVEPKKFDDAIVKYYESGEFTDELADMVNKIAHKLSYAPNFINYTYREDMVGDALIRMFKALISKKYDREKGTNPFSYFTRIAFNAFRNRIKKEKHINETHLKYQEDLVFMTSNQNAFKNKKGLYHNDKD